MNAPRGVIRLGRPSKSSRPVPPAPETVPVRYVVVATTPEGAASGYALGSVHVINEDVRRRPVNDK